MKSALAFLVVVSVTVAAGQPLRRPNHVLDIVSYPMTPEPSEPSEPGGIGAGGRSWVEGQVPTDIALRATLVSMDSGSYLTGDPLTYEIEVENTGSKPVVLPWSPDRVLFRTQSALPTATGSIFLEVWDVTGSRRLAWLESKGLLGSTAVAGTLQLLAPGETALFRVPGVWRSSEREGRAVLAEPGGVVQVKGVMMLFEQPLIIRSTNGIEVSVQSRLRR
jgi:hypothetical protein